VLLVAGGVHTASAQTTTRRRGRKFRACRQAFENEADGRQVEGDERQMERDLKVCRKEVKAKGLVGDDRWFYIEDCMEKT
jgi:hypothetical protein